MRLHIPSIGDVALDFLESTYVDITIVPLNAQQLKEKQEHNQSLLEITSSLSYVEFDELKE